MCAFKVGVSLLLVLALAGCGVRCRHLRDQERWLKEERCAALSTTAVSCASHAAGALLPHPDHCELFYYCVSRSAAPVCRQCPARLHFNPALRVCDYPAVAGCGLNSTAGHPSDSASDLPTYLRTAERV